MSHEAVNDVLHGILGAEVTLLLWLVWKLSAFLHRELKAKEKKP